MVPPHTSSNPLICFFLGRMWFHRPVKADDWLLFVVSRTFTVASIEYQFPRYANAEKLDINHRLRARLRMRAVALFQVKCSTGMER